MLSTVQFFVSKQHDSCKVDEREWYITIFNCDGTLLEYAGMDYIVIHAPNGHATVDLPPGKYMAVGVWGYWIGPDGAYHGNHFTHKAIFQVCCGQHVCVWLYNPSAHECGIIYDRALVGLQGNIAQTQQDLIDEGVDPADPRFAAIADLDTAITTNLPAVQALRAEVDNFAQVFGHAIPDGHDINREELIGTPDPVAMNAMVEANSQRIGKEFMVDAKITGTVL